MATNWVQDLFDLIQEANGNILLEDGNYIALQEYQATTWTEDTTVGDG